MTIAIIEATLNARANVLRDAIDAGAGAGVLNVYSGTRPAGPGSAPAGTLLASFTLNDPVAPDAVGGVSTWNDVAPVTIAATGTASWFRVTTSDPTAVFDGDVGVTGSGADLELDSVSLTSGRLISLDSFILTEVNQ